jgi:N-acetylglucosamine kinase-like BadF-type ATPase
MEHDMTHEDDIAVDQFSEAMRNKMRQSREEKGRGGWQNASAAKLTHLLLEHLEKGDPVDVANFCMMLHQNEQSIDALVVRAYWLSITNHCSV